MAGSDTKVPPVYSKEEIYRYIDLGLGRGVDGTDPTPWLNKTSFQVRRVTPDNILGTDEGSSLQSFEEEVSSVKSQQCKMKTSVCIPKSPVAIGASAEFSRTAHSSRRSVGVKIINRTISFRDNFDDIRLSEDDQATTTLQETQNVLTFEERLASWLIEQLKLEWQNELMKGEGSLTPLELPSSSETQQETTPAKKQTALRDLMTIIDKKRREDMKFIANSCKKFIEYYHITHYVNSIQLGASEYQTLTKEEYNTAMSMKTKANVQGIGSAETETNLAFKKKTSAKQCKKIGRISQGQVNRGSYDEAVVQVFIRPISTLIKTSFLNACMQSALTEYIDMQSDKTDGPFLISCGVNRKLYLKVHPLNNAVLATSRINQASEFYIIPSDDTDNVRNNEFYIIHKKLDDEMVSDVERKYSVITSSVVDDSNSISLYLNAPISVWGENSGPLYMEDAVEHKTSRFALNSRVISEANSISCPLDSWINESEMHYIRCSRRSWHYKGYLAVKKWDDVYITSCVNDMKLHDNREVWMLFRLIAKSSQPTPKTIQEHPSLVSLSSDKGAEPVAATEEIPSILVEGQDIELNEM